MQVFKLIGFACSVRLKVKVKMALVKAKKLGQLFKRCRERFATFTLQTINILQRCWLVVGHTGCWILFDQHLINLWSVSLGLTANPFYIQRNVVTVSLFTGVEVVIYSIGPEPLYIYPWFWFWSCCRSWLLHSAPIYKSTSIYLMIILMLSTRGKMIN